MTPPIKSIPTEYNGVMFRSRLEAKWAAMFDSMHWPWEYEPIDLDGYVPDFVIRFGRNLLVEVKPFMSWEDSNDIRHAKVKIEQSGWVHEALIVGAFVSPLCLGLIRDFDAGWGIATPFRCDDCGEHSLLAEDGDWRCRVNGCEVNGRVRHMLDWDIVTDFRKASALVQWRPH